LVLGTALVLSPGGDEAPGDSSVVFTALSVQPACQRVDPDVIFRRDPELGDLGEDRADQSGLR
jgi:hypothetical protein